MAQMSPEVEAALHDIEAAIVRNLDVLTRGLPDIEGAETMLGDWGIVYHVTDLNDGDGWVDGRSGPGMAWHHWTGLLDAVLRQERTPDEEE